MPVKGVILILFCAVVVGIVNKDQIYKWLSSNLDEDDAENNKDEEDTE